MSERRHRLRFRDFVGPESCEQEQFRAFVEARGGVRKSVEKRGKTKKRGVCEDKQASGREE